MALSSPTQPTFRLDIATTPWRYPHKIREPSLVGPLMLTALVARWTAGLLMSEPLYHVLSRSWLPPPPGGAPSSTEAPGPPEQPTKVNPTA